MRNSSFFFDFKRRRQGQNTFVPPSIAYLLPSVFVFLCILKPICCVLLQCFEINTDELNFVVSSSVNLAEADNVHIKNDKEKCNA